MMTMFTLRIGAVNQGDRLHTHAFTCKQEGDVIQANIQKQ